MPAIASVSIVISSIGTSMDGRCLIRSLMRGKDFQSGPYPVVCPGLGQGTMVEFQFVSETSWQPIGIIMIMRACHCNNQLANH